MIKLPVVSAKVLVKARGTTFSDDIHELRDVEVLTVHFTTNSMRVRYMADLWNEGVETVRTTDIPADPLWRQYTLEKRK